MVLNNSKLPVSNRQETTIPSALNNRDSVVKNESDSDNTEVTIIGARVINPTRKEYPNQIDLYVSVNTEHSIPTEKKKNRIATNFKASISSIPIISETLYVIHNKLVRIIEYIRECFCRIVEKINPRKTISSSNIEVAEKTKIAGRSNNVAITNVVALSSLVNETSFNTKPAVIEIAYTNNGKKK